MKKVLSFLLAFVVVIGLLPAVSVAADEPALSRYELMEMLISASDDYNRAEPGDIIRGDGDGQLRYEDKVTRIEALVMIRRAFDKFPALSENRLYSDLTDGDVSFTDIPEWAKEDVEALTAAGLLASSEDGLLHSGAFVTKDEAKTMLRRVWMLYGSNEKDDFFASHEKEIINNSVKYPGYIGVGSSYDVDDRLNKRIDGILEEILAGQWPAGSDQQKIKDYYEAALAVCSGQTSNLDSIRGYLKDVDSAVNLSALMDVIYTLYSETGVSVAFLNPSIDIDIIDSTKNVLWLSPDISPIDADTYSGKAITEAAAEYYKKVLIIGGESEESAKAAAEDIVSYQKALAAVQTAPENTYDVEYYYNVMSLSDADTRLLNIDLKGLLTKLGYSAPDQLVVADLGAFNYLCGYLDDKNIDSLKNIVKYSILSRFGNYLSCDFYDAGLEFNKVIYGDMEPQTAKARARSLLLDELDTEIGKVYVKKFFTQADKDRLLEIERAYVEVYRERLNALDWMSAETKKKAIAKLDAITFKNIWPDYWFTDEESKYVPSFEIHSMADGGSFYKNSTAILRAYRDMNIAKEGTPADKAKWGSSPLEVNAFYYFSENCVYIMAGLLDYPFYDNSSMEALLGSLGASTIGHEITHAFDNSGSKFDANGNHADWWTAEDYEAFTERCGKMEELFNGLEAAPGIFARGDISVGENVADLGGMVLSLEVAKKLIKNPDYKKLFSAHANAWCYSYPRQTVSYLTSFEAHSMPWLRTNIPIMQTDEFYETYGILEGDGMYLPPEERVSIW